MSSPEIQDYLLKQLFIEKNIVTFRSLSRVFFIHVNVAKNELATFHANTRGEHSTVTYLLSGELHPPRYSYYDKSMMELDEYGLSVDPMDDADIEEDSEDPIRTAVMLVSEQDLEVQKLRFAQMYSQTVYCLSPSPIKDGNHLCPLMETVREVDNTQKGVDMSRALGRIVGKGIKLKVYKDPTRASAVPKSGPKAPTTKTKEDEARGKGKEKESSKSDKPTDKQKSEKPTEKPKMIGKLDFSKAKTKEMKEKEKVEATKGKGSAKDATKGKPVKEEKKEEAKFTFFNSRTTTTSKPSNSISDTKKGGKKPEQVDEPKRGVKRKSPARMDSEASEDASEPAKPSTSKASGLRVRKGVVLSDDEDSIIPPLKAGVRKGRVPSAASSVPDSEPPSDLESEGANSEAERELKAMMDVDDDKVERVSRSTALKNNEDEGQSSGAEGDDVAMDDVDDVPKPKPKQRKVKKVIPVGRNGLKKRRVVKSRLKTDDKGYTHTEDYSSYESVDEAEPPPVKKGKGKPKTKDEIDEESTSHKTKEEAAKKDQSTNVSKPSDGKTTGTRKVLKPGGSAGNKGKAQQKSLMTFFSTK